MPKFEKGQSGNRAGKKPGTLNRQPVMLKDASGQILALMIEQALDGNFEAQRFLLDRTLPRMKAVTPADAFDLNTNAPRLEQIKVLMQQVANGTLAASTASEVVDMVEASAKIEEIDNLRTELAALRRVLEARGKKK